MQFEKLLEGLEILNGSLVEEVSMKEGYLLFRLYKKPTIAQAGRLRNLGFYIERENDETEPTGKTWRFDGSA